MRRILGASLALVLAGCVVANTQMLDNRTAVISARGSGFSDTADVARKVLIEAATMAQARGYEYFQILGAQDQTQVGTYVNPGSSSSNTSGFAHCAGNFCHGTATTTTNYTPGYAMPVVRLGADVAVRFLHASEVSADMRGVWSAASVLSQGK